jgi:hypothetical protein
MVESPFSVELKNKRAPSHQKSKNFFVAWCAGFITPVHVTWDAPFRQPPCIFALFDKPIVLYENRAISKPKWVMRE